MKKPDLVAVFNFSESELGTDFPAMSPCKATRETIERTFKARALEGSGETMPREALDGKARYRPIATGRGELPEA